MQPTVYYGPGQQPGFMPQQAQRGGMPFAPQPGMVIPGIPGQRPGQFPAGLPQQGGRGFPGAQGIPPNAFGMQQGMPLGMQPGPGYPNGMYNQALATVQASLGGRGQGGRGQIAGMQNLPPQMAGVQGMRGVGGPQGYPQPGGRGQMPMPQPGQMRGMAPSGRGQMISPMIQPGIPQSREEGIGAGGLTPQSLISAPPQQQKQMLGEALYPKIVVYQPELAGKITGMLLEMDNAELLSL